MRFWSVALGGLMACTSGASGSLEYEVSTTTVDTASTSDTDTGSGSTGPGDSAEVESLPGVVDPADQLFSLERVHTLAITLGPELQSALGSDPYDHVETDVVFDDRLLTGVGVRLKGRYGSFRSLSGKAGFKIDVNRFHEAQTLYGLTHLNINNMVQDGAQLHDRVAYNTYRLAGVPAPRVGYVWVTVDGEDYGLYALVEDYDKRFLEEHFEEPGGNLYDGDYWLADDWSWYVLVDFEQTSQEYFDLDEGTDVGLEDIHGITAAVEASCGSQDFDETMNGVLDFDHWLSFWAMEIWVGQWDGYNYNSNNYRVYFDPGRDGRAIMMPWDHDQPFYQNLPISQPVGLLGACCKADLGCRERLYTALDEVCEVVEGSNNLALTGSELLDDVRETIDLINPYVREDPRREFTYETVLYYQDVTEDWVQDRCESLYRWGGF